MICRLSRRLRLNSNSCIKSGKSCKQGIPGLFCSATKLILVTWEPDSYGFGDATYWMQLHEEMRQAGFYIKTVEESCEHFAIMDQEIVWYGSMNLLAKSNADDSMMRVQSKKIVMELMGLTFGKES